MFMLAPSPLRKPRSKLTSAVNCWAIYSKYNGPYVHACFLLPGRKPRSERVLSAIISQNSKRVRAPAGSLIYIPANAPHTLVAAADDEDVIFIAIKDLSQGIIGRAVDGKMTGPHYDKGFGPKRVTRGS